MLKQKSTHVDDPAAVGARLREARERAGYSQRDLAFPGCSAAYISRIEAGKRRPDLALLRAVAGRLGATAEELLHGVSRDRRAEMRLSLDYAELSLRSGNPADALEKAAEVLDGAVEASVAELQAAKLRADIELLRAYGPPTSNRDALSSEVSGEAAVS